MLRAQFKDGFGGEHIHAQRAAGDEMAIAHVVERLNGFLDAALEIDAARVGFVEAEGHFLRAIAGERAALCAGRAVPSYCIRHERSFSLHSSLGRQRTMRATRLFIRFASSTPSKDTRTGAVRGFSRLQSI